MMPQHKYFADRFRETFNVKQSAIDAGYSARTARQAGSRVLARDDVQAYLAGKAAEIEQKTDITIEWIVRELHKIGSANMKNYTRLVGTERVIDLTDTTDDELAAVSEITVEDFKEGRGDDTRDVRRVKIKLHNKQAALVDLLKFKLMTEGHRFPASLSRDGAGSGAGAIPDAGRREIILVNDPDAPGNYSLPEAAYGAATPLE